MPDEIDDDVTEQLVTVASLEAGRSTLDAP